MNGSLLSTVGRSPKPSVVDQPRKCSGWDRQPEKDTGSGTSHGRFVTWGKQGVLFAGSGSRVWMAVDALFVGHNQRSATWISIVKMISLIPSPGKMQADFASWELPLDFQWNGPAEERVLVRINQKMRKTPCGSHLRQTIEGAPGGHRWTCEERGQIHWNCRSARFQ